MQLIAHSPAVTAAAPLAAAAWPVWPVAALRAAMTVHDREGEGLFPNKKPATQKLFAGFLEAIAGAVPSRAALR